MIKIALTKEGDFTVPIEGEHQCGLRGSEHFTYRVEIYAHAEALDERGFLVDQLDVNNWIVAHFKELQKFESCELSALQIIKLLRSHVTAATKIVAQVRMVHSSGFITAEWNNERA